MATCRTLADANAQEIMAEAMQAQGCTCTHDDKACFLHDVVCASILRDFPSTAIKTAGQEGPKSPFLLGVVFRIPVDKRYRSLSVAHLLMNHLFYGNSNFQGDRVDTIEGGPPYWYFALWGITHLLCAHGYNDKPITKEGTAVLQCFNVNHREIIKTIENGMPYFTMRGREGAVLRGMAGRVMKFFLGDVSREAFGILQSSKRIFRIMVKCWVTCSPTQDGYEIRHGLLDLILKNKEGDVHPLVQFTPGKDNHRILDKPLPFPSDVNLRLDTLFGSLTSIWFFAGHIKGQLKDRRLLNENLADEIDVLHVFVMSWDSPFYQRVIHKHSIHRDVGDAIIRQLTVNPFHHSTRRVVASGFLFIRSMICAAPDDDALVSVLVDILLETSWIEVILLSLFTAQSKDETEAEVDSRFLLLIMIEHIMKTSPWKPRLMRKFTKAARIAFAKNFLAEAVWSAPNEKRYRVLAKYLTMWGWVVCTLGVAKEKKSLLSRFVRSKSASSTTVNETKSSNDKNEDVELPEEPTIGLELEKFNTI
ncbi:hypothetical protein B0H34DRAFT_498782 [Crassisporium funariophilum]|nr:hypothetical protein B0H34DRAFT_498782 [Crassisporium funariophilum]